MPVYCYSPKSGDLVVDRVFASDKRPNSITVDGARYYYDFAATQGSVRMAPPGNWPMQSNSVGVHPSQCEEVERISREAGVPTHFDRETGNPTFTSRSHRRAYCDSINFHDNDAGYGDPTP